MDKHCFEMMLKVGTIKLSRSISLFIDYQPLF